MKAYILETPGGPTVLRMQECPIPVPGPREVLVRVRANSLNARDLLVMQGKYAVRGAPAHLVPLSDGAGKVVEVGADVRRVKPGDRVCGAFYQDWLGGPRSGEPLRQDLGGGVHGMLAEYVVLGEQGVVHIPPHLSYEEAATLPCAAVTAWSALTAMAPLLPGNQVLVQGTGGVALFAIQLARLFGAGVIATASSAAKCERLIECGADHAIDSTSNPHWDDAVLQRTGGQGVDVAVELVGEPDKLVRCVRPGGRVGVVARHVPAQKEPRIIGRHVCMFGVGVGSRDDFVAMNQAIAAHGLRPIIDRAFPFTEVAEAFDAMQSRGRFGKIVITHAASAQLRIL